MVQDVTFALEAGKGLGIIGPSASGKSSLARCWSGCGSRCAARSGIDGAALDQWMPEELGRHIGYLPQDVELFAGTVAQNICPVRGRCRSRSDHRRRQAAGVHDLIVGLPEGYETAGRRKGQRAVGRTAAAHRSGPRAIRDPFLVVLDEPNANLDSEGDEALAAQCRGPHPRRHCRCRRAPAERARGVDLMLVMSRDACSILRAEGEVLPKVLPRRPLRPAPSRSSPKAERPA